MQVSITLRVHLEGTRELWCGIFRLEASSPTASLTRNRVLIIYLCNSSNTQVVAACSSTDEKRANASLFYANAYMTDLLHFISIYTKSFTMYRQKHARRVHFFFSPARTSLSLYPSFPFLRRSGDAFATPAPEQLTARFFSHLLHPTSRSRASNRSVFHFYPSVRFVVHSHAIPRVV